ncbi:MAG: hypothetical protein FJ088_03475 [Deltaproteobacteria bacterium]|nr:hypothetical protein [Deltaproteobacteria bacterium]
MKKMMVIVFLATAFFPIAGFSFVNNVSLSAGEGVIWVNGEASRTPFNLELVPSFSFAIVKIDLGLWMDFENKTDFMLRPGVRICPPFLYVRGAIPLRLTNGFDYGFLLGLGKNLLSLGIASIFIEVDTYFTKEGEFDVVPVEGRIGVEVGF